MESKLANCETNEISFLQNNATGRNAPKALIFGRMNAVVPPLPRLTPLLMTSAVLCVLFAFTMANLPHPSLGFLDGLAAARDGAGSPDMLFFGLLLLTTVISAAVGFRSIDRELPMWQLLAGALLLRGVGDGLFLLPVPSEWPISLLAKTFQIASMVSLIMAGFKLLRPSGEHKTERQELNAVDALIVACSLGSVSWFWGLGEHIAGMPSVQATLEVLHLQLQLLSMATIIVLKLYMGSSRFTVLLLGSALLFSMSGLVDVFFDTSAGFSAFWMPCLRALSAVLLALAVGQAVLPSEASARQRVTSALPMVSILITCGVVFLSRIDSGLDEIGLTVGLMVCLMLLIWRQNTVIQRNQRMSHHLESLAYRDELTSLPNRAALTDFFNGERLGPDQPYTIFSLDLNGFKSINDNFGHAVGDLILVHVGKMLRQTLPKGGEVYRWGGDEFVIVVPNMTKAEDANLLVSRIVKNVNTPLAYRSHKLQVGTSVGYAMGRGPKNYEMLLSMADSGMYHDKESSGKGR